MYTCIYIYVLVIVYKTNIYIYVCVCYFHIYIFYIYNTVHIHCLPSSYMCNRVACMHAPNSKRPSSIKHCRFQAFRDGFCYTDSVVALIQVLAMFLWISVGFSISVHGLRQTRGPAHFVHSFGSSYLGTRTCCLHPHVLSFPRCPRRCSNCRKPYG